MPKLSVISGAYNANACPHFRKSIESVLGQSFSDFEFIICDDGSTDDTLDLLREYEKRDRRVKILANEKNLGLAAALNRCIEISKGKYVARHDLDDYSIRDRFERQINYLDTHKEIAILGTGVWLFDEGGVWDKEIMPRKVRSEDFLFNNPYKHGSVMFRAKELKRAGGYRVAKETMRNEDYDLFMRMQLFCKGENLSEPLYCFCEDKSARKRRKYRYRINEAIVRYKGFKILKLMPRAIPYVIKPLAVGLIPQFLLKKLQIKRRKNNCNV